MSLFYMAVYLGAIVSANLAVATFGQAALPLTAFVLIPFDLVTRDILHDKWKGKYLWWKMAGLVLGGSLLTAILSWNAMPIAIASTAAFALAGTTNAFVYHLMRKHKRLLRMNVSNLFAAVVDSLVFPFIAFESVSLLLCGGQAAAKFGGGVFWSVLFVSLVAFTKRAVK